MPRFLEGKVGAKALRAREGTTECHIFFCLSNSILFVGESQQEATQISLSTRGRFPSCDSSYTRTIMLLNLKHVISVNAFAYIAY